MTNQGPLRKVGLASDGHAHVLKDQILEVLAESRAAISVLSFDAFPAAEGEGEEGIGSLAQAISSKEIEGGIFVGTTAHGVPIVANKYPGIRAVAVLSAFEAKLARSYFDANLLCLGQSTTDIQTIIAVWLTTPFEDQTGFRPSRHAQRVAKIAALEESLQKTPKPLCLPQVAY